MTAAAGGLLDESRWVDLKRELKAGRPGNTDLAVDIAAMSLEGGLLLYGVVDHNSHAGEVVGVELAGLADRVDQVARMKVHDPVMVRCVEIPDPNRPGWGCLLVIVPPSSLAPHMVDNVYYGRGDRANHKLSNADVRQTLAVRAQQQHDVRQQLQRLREEDPVPEPHAQGHLYVIAQPLATADDVMANALTGPDLQHDVLTMSSAISGELGEWAPNLNALTRFQRRADGIAFTSYYDPKRVTERDLLELVLREDGSVALTCGRATDTITDRIEDYQERVVFPTLVLGLTHSLIAVAGRLAGTVNGYQGQWSIGVLVDSLKDVGPFDGRRTWGDMGVPYSRHEYQHITTTSTYELVVAPAAVVQRLLGRLMRGLAVDKRYLPYTPEVLRRRS